MAFVSGARDVQADTDDHILDLEKGMKFLNPVKDGIAFMKALGFAKNPVKSYKHEWTETALATRRETVSLTTTTTTLTVADAYMYQVDDLIRLRDEIIRVSAIASATTLTVVRAQAGTSDPGTTHSSVSAIRLGSARAENSTSNSSVTDTATKLYNYVQTFDKTVEMSTHEIAQLSTEDGNPFQGQLKRRMIEVMRDLTASLFYGVRGADTTNKRYFAGGLKQFVTTNVTDASAADLSNSLLDTLIQAIVDAGGAPTHIVVNTTQKRKLDAIDAELIRTSKGTKTGGLMDVQEWQSGVLTYPLKVIVDHTLSQDELWVVDKDQIQVKRMSNNGAGHGFRLLDATTPGQDGKETRILGHYTFQVGLEESHGYLYALKTTWA